MSDEPQKKQIYAWRIQCWKELQQFSNAVKEIDEAVREFPKDEVISKLRQTHFYREYNSEELISRLRCLKEQEKWDEIITLIDKHIQQPTTDAGILSQYYAFRGEASFKHGQSVQAEQDGMKALEYNSQNAECHRWLARMYFALSNSVKSAFHRKEYEKLSNKENKGDRT